MGQFIDTKVVSGSSEEQDQYLIINRSKKLIKLRLKVFMLEQGEHWVTYIPTLEMSGYGRSKEEASKMLDVILDDYFDDLLESKQSAMESELRKYGWAKDKLHSKQFHNNSFIDKNGVLKNFEMPENTPIEESTLTV